MTSRNAFTNYFSRHSPHRPYPFASPTHVWCMAQRANPSHGCASVRARLGGDEFVVVLPHTGIAGAGVLAEKLLRSIDATPLHTRTGMVRMSVSIGARGLDAIIDRDAATPETLLELADQCLYRSKRAGRNRATIPKVIDAPGGNAQPSANQAVLQA
jgi:predicted signal transduction protein with EAL and GGDEF domain